MLCCRLPCHSLSPSILITPDEESTRICDDDDDDADNDEGHAAAASAQHD